MLCDNHDYVVIVMKNIIVIVIIFLTIMIGNILGSYKL